MVSSLVFFSRNCVNAAPVRYMRQLLCSVSQAHAMSSIGYWILSLRRISCSQLGPKASHNHLRVLYRIIACSRYGPVMSTRWVNRPYPFMRRSSLISVIISAKQRGLSPYCYSAPSLASTASSIHAWSSSRFSCSYSYWLSLIENMSSMSLGTLASVSTLVAPIS